MKHTNKFSTVMLVDDNDTDNYINNRVIKLSHFADNVLVHNSGKSALEYLELNKNRLENLPDIIFLDINMPVINGFVFLFEFDNFPEDLKDKCKVIILSSSDNKNDIERINENNLVKSFLTKPLSDEDLKEIASHFISRSLI